MITRTRAEYAKKAEELAESGADSVTALLDLTITTAIELCASDIHLEPANGDTTVRLRLDGVMQDFGSLPEKLAPNIVARSKVLARLLSYRSDIPQEGGASRKDTGYAADLRISTFPTLHGERVAIRIFDPGEKRKELGQLGLSTPALNALREALRRPEGLLLLTGPSGSGKTTTLYASLAEIMETSSCGRSIVTVEDPVENELPGATQTSVNEAAGLTFATSLRSLLRQDPEVIMVGEVRDTETAKIAVQAALTGHLVLSTVHAPFASAVPHRLLEMGVEPYALAGSLSLVVAQRLARKLCKRCSQQQSGNCPDCHGSGFHQRLLIAEYLSASVELHNAIMSKASRATFTELIHEDLASAARQLVEAELTSADEIKRILTGESL